MRSVNMKELSLTTIANQCFGVPFAGGSTVLKASFGGPEIGGLDSTMDPSISGPKSPGV